MTRKKTLGIKKMFRCKKCGGVSTNADQCPFPKCGAMWEQEPVKKAWEKVKDYGPEGVDSTLDGTTPT